MGEQSYMAIVSKILDDAPGSIDVPRAEIARSLRELEHEKIWMNYDEESDSLIMYFTGQPVQGLNVQMGDDHHVIVDPLSHRVVGFYLENVICPDKRNL